MKRRRHTEKRTSNDNRCLFSHVGGAVFIDEFKIMNEARKHQTTYNRQIDGDAGQRGLLSL